MLPKEGRDGQRASWDWITCGSILVIFGGLAICTIIQNPKFLHTIGHSGRNFNCLQINLKFRQALPMNWSSDVSIAGREAAKNGQPRMKETSLKKTKFCSVGRFAMPSTVIRVLFAIALGVVGKHTAHGSAYLPCVGPPLLRFEPAPLHNAAAASPFVMPAVVKRSRVAVPAVEPLSNTTNTTNAPATAAVSPEAADNSGRVSSPIISLPSATDAAVVTPQMLADFLKPTAGGAIFVPVKVGFTPPAPPAGESSRAVYKSQ
jgi:hypothetical protein